MTDRLFMLNRSQTEPCGLFQTLNLSASQLREVIQKAQETADVWNAKSVADQRAALQTVLVKVQSQSDHVELLLSQRGLLQNILGTTVPKASQTENNNDHPSPDPEDDVVCIQTTNCLEPSGNGLRLIINDTNQNIPNMQRAPLLAEAFTFRETLLKGPHDRIEAMSTALQLGKGSITSRIRQTFLSPRLIRKILNCDMPNVFDPTSLLESSKDLPVKWAEQARFFEALAR
ncbi:MAG: hypothetical protein WCC66_02005 [Rhizobiaceae bacterium]